MPQDVEIPKAGYPIQAVPAMGCATCVNAEAFTARVRVAGNIRNNPSASMPAGWGGANVISPPLEGEFGPSTISIAWLVADDPLKLYQWFETLFVPCLAESDLYMRRYNPGDTITIVFNQPTNLAGLPVTNIT
jgi:hypothetical protein